MLRLIGVLQARTLFNAGINLQLQKYWYKQKKDMITSIGKELN